MYNKIVNDDEYLNMISEIEKHHFITDGKWDWEHGLEHAKMVTTYIERILEALHVDDHTLELGLISGVLHDIGLVNGVKQNHAYNSANLANEYLKKFNLSDNDIKIIVQAIQDHSRGSDIESVVGAALLLADKLDLSKHRVIASTVKDDINREFLKVDNVTVDITAEDLIVNYTANNDFNVNILKNWNKSISVPIKVAKYFNKNLIFKINNQEYDVAQLL